MADETYVVVGGGLAGGKAAEILREEGFDGEIVLVTAEDRPPYERPVLSKGFLLGSDPVESAYVHEASWWDAHDITVRTRTTATGLRLDDRLVELADGTTLGYDKLLLATGSWPRRLDVPGADLDGVLYLRTMPEAERIKGILDAGGPLVIIGAGWIGLEVAAAARTHDVPVTILETADLPLQRVLGDRVAEVFAALHRKHGVDLRLGTGVAEIRGDAGVTSVVTTDGDEIPAAAVVVGIGATPQCEWALAAGLAGEGGIDTDASMRTSDPAVWAAGDIAAAEKPRLGRRVRVEHWAMANDSGPVAARSMLGQDVTYDKLPFFYTDQYDLGMEYVGAVSDPATADVVVRGNADPSAGPLAFHAFWLDDGIVGAAMHVNMWDDGLEPLKALVGTRVDPARLADTDVPLTDLATG
ncbi:oxidoreductase [Mumia zhuanghuii]|uniref:NAD(P)/FAD-dependent oxidoreductase n=2 Tax=Mumia TaxID=1546255 RepID=A0ABW1QPH4_9ACTN|nr:MULTISPECIES: FAD-dependent oxidoreductase [Mumia]KAA1423848.1 oxidoreductase [Mumia zhuanghuii]